jgi:tetratricopeptide (TPR) repeat protein
MFLWVKKQIKVVFNQKFIIISMFFEFSSIKAPRLIPEPSLELGFSLLSKNEGLKSLIFFLKYLDSKYSEQASLGLALSLISLKENKKAEVLLIKLTKSTKINTYAYYYLGKLLLDKKDFSFAINNLEKASVNKNIRKHSLFMLIEILLIQNSLKKAKEKLLQSISEYPQEAEFQCLLADVYLKEKNYELALETLWICIQNKHTSQKSISKLTSYFKEINDSLLTQEYLFKLLRINLLKDHLYELKSIIERPENRYFAINLYLKAIKNYPEEINFQVSLGELYIFEDELVKAEEIFKKALSVTPKNLKALVGLGSTYQNLKKYKESLNYFQKALEISPENSNLLTLMGISHASMRNNTKSLFYFKKSHEIAPYQDNFINLNLHRQQLSQKSFSEKKEFFLEYSKKSPSPDVFLQLSHFYLIEKKFKTFFKYQEKSFEISQKTSENKLQFSNVCLAFEKFEKAWKLYNSRIDLEDIKRNFSKNITSFPKQGKKILFRREQGLGDFILFGFFLRALNKYSNNEISIEIDNRLKTTFERSFPSFNFILQQPPIVKGYDYIFPIGHLGFYFGKDTNCFPKNFPYLFPNFKKLRYFKKKYQKLFPNKRLVGFSWKTTSSQTKELRSIPLKEFLQITTDSQIQWINLQYKMTEEEKQTLSLKKNIYTDPELDVFEDIDSLCALLSSLDQVITIDNSTVHLCGALGVPTFNLIGYFPNWAWGISRKTPLWYSNMKLLRQNKIGHWSETLHLAKKLLTKN